MARCEVLPDLTGPGGAAPQPSPGRVGMQAQLPRYAAVTGAGRLGDPSFTDHLGQIAAAQEPQHWHQDMRRAARPTDRTPGPPSQRNRAWPPQHPPPGEPPPAQPAPTRRARQPATDQLALDLFLVDPYHQHRCAPHTGRGLPAPAKSTLACRPTTRAWRSTRTRTTRGLPSDHQADCRYRTSTSSA